MKRVMPSNGRVPINKIRLILDSGAYSAWSKGETIDVRDYIKFCHENKHSIWKIINLDVLPGKRHAAARTVAEVDASALASHSNLQKMKEAGLRPIPVFHQGERMYWLETMLRDGEKFIGLGSSKSTRVSEQLAWYNQCFNVLSDSQGRPFVKVHGFGATAFKVMVNYPWYSVDSTTWALTPGYGQIIVPARIGKQFDYLHPTRVTMSGIEQKNTVSQQKQFEAIKGPARAAIEIFIEEVVQSTIAAQRYSPYARRRAMLVYYINLVKHLTDVRYLGDRCGIFGPDHFDTSDLRAIPPHQMILSFATQHGDKQSAKMMNEIGANDRLLSYWYMRNIKPETLEDYVRDGTFGDDYVPQVLKQNWSSDTYRNRRRLALLHHIRNAREK